MNRRTFVKGGLAAIVGVGLGFGTAHSQLNVTKEFLHKLGHGYASFVNKEGDKRYVDLQAFEEGKTYFLRYGVEEVIENREGQPYRHLRLRRDKPLILRVNIENTPNSPIERFEDRNLDGLVDIFAIETIDKEGRVHEKPVYVKDLPTNQRESVQLRYERGLRALARRLPYR